MTLPPGVAFLNGFLGHEKGKSLLTFYPYNKDTFVIETLPVEPTPYILEEESKEIYFQILNKEKRMDNKLIEDQRLLALKTNPFDHVKEHLKDKVLRSFLEVITENDPLKAVALRSILQRIIMSPVEGCLYQQAFWLWGAPGSVKSTWLKIEKMMAQGSIMELNKFRNPFSSVLLMNIKLLLISDVNRLSQDMIEMLRVILGRDSLYAEYKHTNKYETIDSYCQCIIVSNKNPNEFPNILERPEIRDKITLLKFNESIPQHLMISNIKAYLTKYAYHFFLWAIFTPRFFLEQQTRGKLLQKYLEKEGKIDLTDLHHYIEERLVVPINKETNGYVLKSDLRTDFEKWLNNNALIDEINDLKKTLKYLPSQLIETLSTDYSIEVENKRIQIKNQRLYILSGIQLVSEDMETEKYSNIKMPKADLFDFNSKDPYESAEYIQDVSIQGDVFYETQLKIIQLRKEKEK